MKEIWNLIKYEYKKIISKRNVQITLFLAIVMAGLIPIGTICGKYYVNGEVFESNYDAMVKDRTYARALAGRQLDGQLILEAVNAFSTIPESEKNYHDAEEYHTTARPYNGIYLAVRSIYNTNSKRFNMEDFQRLTHNQADGFYDRRRDQQEQLVNQTHMSAKAKEQILALDTQIITPFKFAYTDGYTRFFVFFNTLGLMAAFTMAVCVAPLFSGEYTSGVDQLILSSKYGKNKLIIAKLFTGFSMSGVICLVLTTLNYALSMFILGSDGGDAPLQLYMILSPYPLTMWQVTLLLEICAFFACTMTAAITMLLSAKLKSSFSVIIFISALLIVPMLGSMSETNRILFNLFRLLPTQIMSLYSTMVNIPYEIFGLVLKPYVFLPLFGAALSLLLAPFTYRSFKNHQIS